MTMRGIIGRLAAIEAATAPGQSEGQRERGAALERLGEALRADPAAIELLYGPLPGDARSEAARVEREAGERLATLAGRVGLTW